MRRPLATPPRLLFERQYAFGAGITIANYDATPDGQRFIMVKDEAAAARLLLYSATFNSTVMP